MSAAGRTVRELRAKIRAIPGTAAILGEGPVFDPRDGKVWWLDIKGRILFATDLESNVTRRWDLPCRLGSLVVPDDHWPAARRAEGNFLCAGDRGFAWLSVSDDSVSIETIVHPEADVSSHRFNDGKLGPDGRYFAGTMDDAEVEDTGVLYAMSPDGKAAVIDTGYRVPNGPAFSPDAHTLYHNDSARRIVYAFELGEGGQVGACRIFHQFGPDAGYPDGMTVARDGRLFVAMWDGSGISVLTADGRPDARIAMPTARVTSCAWVDRACKRLVATSASIGLGDDDELAGSLFEIELP